MKANFTFETLILRWEGSAVGTLYMKHTPVGEEKGGKGEVQQYSGTCQAAIGLWASGFVCLIRYQVLHLMVLETSASWLAALPSVQLWGAVCSEPVPGLLSYLRAALLCVCPSIWAFTGCCCSAVCQCLATVAPILHNHLICYVKSFLRFYDQHAWNSNSLFVLWGAKAYGLLNDSAEQDFSCSSPVH